MELKETALQTKNLTKSFAQNTAVNNINLSLEKGTIFALLGPNGSGKSTLVKMLVGIIKPTSGDASILNKSIITDIDEIKKTIGVLPETLGLFEGLNIWEHLLLAGDVYRVPAKEAEYRAEQLLKYLDLWNSRTTKIEKSSYGMKKKCSLAMALIHNPEIVFLDEPFEGIDPISAGNIKKIFTMLAKRGATVFITSHIIDIMEKLVDSFAIISNGEIICRMNLEDVHREGLTLEETYYKYIDDNLTGDLSWLET
jgi:ABC-2 type transport system ATP-binding protein